MNKKLTSMLLVGAFMMSMTGCSFGGDRDDEPRETTERTRETTEDDEEITETTTESVPDTTFTTAPGSGNAPDPIPAPGIVIDGAAVPLTNVSFNGDTDYTPSDDHEYIYPYVYQRIDVNLGEISYFDMLYGFVDQDGNPVCDPIFTNVYMSSESGNYIVTRELDSGDKECGIISLDGSQYSGLIYDAYSTNGSRSTEDIGYAYMSRYESGTLYVTYYDDQLNPLYEDKEITVNEAELSCFYPNRELHVAKVYDNDRAIIYQSDMEIGCEYAYLIDTTTGECLYEIDPLMGRRYFGEYIVETDFQEYCAIHDLNGEQIYEEYNRTEMVSSDRLALAGQGIVSTMDLDGNIVASIGVDDEFDFVVAVGKVIVGIGDHIDVYDKDLNLLYSADGISLDDGFVIRGWDDFVDDDVILEYRDTDQAMNLRTGVSTPIGDLYWGTDYNYITADDRSNGNVNVHTFRVYDFDLNCLLEGNGIVEYYQDFVTGDVYAVSYLENNSYVYRLGDNGAELVFELDNERIGYGVTIVDGIISCFSYDGRSFLINSDGEVIFAQEIIE